LLLNGALPVEVARLAGHSTTATTLRIYAHAIKKELFESASIMEGIMNKRQDSNQEQQPLNT
jgi:integrase